jgi:Zn-dependent protease with chaperone function
MDSRSVTLAIMALTAGFSFIVWVIANTVVRLRQTRAPKLGADLEARLARIETAVETIAIEVERNGELQRFNARLAQGGAAPEPVRIARPITPT